MTDLVQSDARILVVDDNPTNTALLEAILEEAGYRHIDLANDPVQVPRMCRRTEYDLILLDIRMPKMDGHAVMAALFDQLDEGDFLPVIVLTAQSDAGTRERALAAGARDFITKPFDSTEVLQRIENVLEIRALHKERTEKIRRLAQKVNQQSRTLQSQERSLEYLATHNSITDLPNRRAMITELSNRLADGEYGKLAAVLIQVEGHSRLESLEGYDFADRVLRLLGERLREALPSARAVGYWGSACYLLLLQGSDSDALMMQARQLVELLVQPVRLQGYALLLSARAGVAVAPEDGDGASMLLKRAALALSMSPQSDKPVLRRFHSGFEEDIRARHRMEAALRQAAAQGQLQMFHQAKICLETGRLAGVEALMRWNHPELGAVSPGRFIPLAEETGLISELGRWAIDESLAAVARWREQTGECVPVSVNVSARQFDLLRARGESLSDLVSAALDAAGVPAACLELEITETAIMQDLDHALAQLEALRGMGVRLAIDDFGVGHSSLAYLQKLPVSTIKIDRSLVDGIAASQRSRALIQAVLAVTQAFGLVAVAEGVEKSEDADLLRMLKCPVAQGFLFHRPVPEPQILSLIAEVGVAPVTD
ncbi:MAG: putative bifunctional diguanylate cyclase/phosphodiesterase [Halothiobacillaceae bacterium]